jgi:polyphosphate kinase
VSHGRPTTCAHGGRGDNGPILSGPGDNVTSIAHSSQEPRSAESAAAAVPAEAAPGEAEFAAAEPAEFPYIDRELSSLEFNRRVLFEARDKRNPLLERVKFLAIVASNLDEFFQIRAAGLLDRRDPGAAEQLSAIRSCYRGLLAEQSEAQREIFGALGRAGIKIADYAAVPEEHERLRQRFIDEILPLLTPLAVDPGHPFPYISTLSLSLAIRMRDPEEGPEEGKEPEPLFARVKVPPNMPRLLALGGNRFVPVEQVMAANLDLLFSGMEIQETHFFRITRDADLELKEDEADDLALALEEELRRRRFGGVIRLEVDRAMPAEMRRIVEKGLSVESEDCYEIAGLIDHTCLWEIAALDRPGLKLAPYTPVVPPRLAQQGKDEPADIFAALAASGDILVHHPYESFAASTQRFISQAASDPDVQMIKMTLYRTSGDSPIVQDLIRAAEAGKQVAVLVEIRARFDEQANITWGRRLEQAGAHVVYGMVGLKTHSKTVLVVRREGQNLRRYVHIGTGNYNPGTARLYTDLGLLSCSPELGEDVQELFNILTGLSRQRHFRRLIVAPWNLRPWILSMIERETANARQGRQARIVLKLNSLVDRECTRALYEASQAGVRVDLIIRGICSLWPGLEGVSTGIRVRSIVGKYLEHSRVLGFDNDGRPEWYIGSADLMERNLDRRVEALVPIEDLEAKARIATIIDGLLADDRRSWQLCPDGRYRRTEELNGAAGKVDAFDLLQAQARASVAQEAPASSSRHRARGSLDPRA